MTFRRPISLCAAAAALFILASCAGEDEVEQYSVVNAHQLNEIVAAHKGDVVVLNFWATWCEPCREEFPALVQLDGVYRQRGVTVIGMSADEPDLIDSEVQPFIDGVGAEFLILVKAYGDPMDFLDAINPDLSGALPETIVYQRDGSVSQILSGEQSFEAFEKAVQRAL